VRSRQHSAVRRTAAVAMQFYASPEQIMRDRSELARKGIARGRSAVVLSYSGGVLFVAENLSSALHKVSEIYDRIGFAAVGRYNEYESLRSAGVRMADLRGYSYDRRDVTARALANAYSATLGSIFQEQGTKPFEVEICVAEVGGSPAGGEGGAPRQLAATQLEVAVLDRGKPGRSFRRVVGGALTAHLPATPAPAA